MVGKYTFAPVRKTSVVRHHLFRENSMCQQLQLQTTTFLTFGTQLGQFLEQYKAAASYLSNNHDDNIGPTCRRNLKPHQHMLALIVQTDVWL